MNALRLRAVVLSHRTAGMVVNLLESLLPQLEVGRDQVTIVETADDDEAAPRLQQALAVRGYTALCQVILAPGVSSRAAGHNLGIRAGEAESYLLLNSDTLLRPGAIAGLLAEMQAHPGVGIAGPRFESLDGRRIASCFRDLTPCSELLDAAQTESVTRLLAAYDPSLPLAEEACEVQWLSFACALIRRQVLEKVGLLDEGFRRYFEDADFCRAARAVGFRVRYVPEACVVRLGGLGSELAQHVQSRRRAPHAFYSDRARYYRKGYGSAGLWAANALWEAGRAVSLSRELSGRKSPHLPERAWRDNWTDSLKPQR